MKRDFDVIVVGAGTAGVIAAAQAGRAGASTLLVEKSAALGGTMTTGGINRPKNFFARGKQVIAGIGWELLVKTWRESGVPVPDPELGTTFALVNPGIYMIFAELALEEAGVEALYHAMPATVERRDERWKLQVCTKTGLRLFTAKVLIDCTGDANLVGMAGFELIGSDIVQPGTLSFSCSGYKAEDLDFDELDRAAAKAVANGEIQVTDVAWGGKRGDGPKQLLERYGHNPNHIEVADANTSEGRTIAEKDARKSLLRMYRFLRKQPGLENFSLDWVFPETGIRESVRIKGKKMVTVEEYEAGKMFEDALCYAFFSIDEHLNHGQGLNARPLQPDALPTIPRGAMLPEGSEFLIVAGRSVSSDRAANSGLRVQCHCMAMGQAAGVMAAMSSAKSVDPEALDLDEIRAALREHGAITPPDKP